MYSIYLRKDSNARDDRLRYQRGTQRHGCYLDQSQSANAMTIISKVINSCVLQMQCIKPKMVYLNSIIT